MKVHGYLEVQIQYLEQLDEPTYVDYSKLKVRKVNGTRKIFGNVTCHIPLDNTYLCEALVYIKQGGQYRLMPYKLPKKGVCDVHNEDKYFYPDLVAASDFPMPYPCPLPTVENGKFDCHRNILLMTFPIFRAGMSSEASSCL